MKLRKLATFILGVAVSTACIADTIVLTERVINSAQPNTAQVPFPQQKIELYRQEIGFPHDCTVATKYDGMTDGYTSYFVIENIRDRCTPPSAPPDPLLMQIVKYPVKNPPGLRPHILFAHPDDWEDYPAKAHSKYWNLINSNNHPGYVFADAAVPRETRRYLQFANMSPHFADDQVAGRGVAYDYKLYYRISNNGGQSFLPPPEPDPDEDEYDGMSFRPVIAAGQTRFQPFPAMHVGDNGASVSAVAHIGKSIAGDVLAGMFITEGLPVNYATTVSSAYVLRGQWNGSGTDVTWSISQPASLSATYSTRGSDEPAVLELSAQNTGAVNCIIVARASNEYTTLPAQFHPGIAGHHWLFRSIDGCVTWSGPPIRLGYSDGTQFFAPAAPSILFRSPRNGRIYWVGSISAANSRGNWPRTTLVAGELDLQSPTPGIVKDTVTILDQMAGNDTDKVALTNAQIAPQPDGSAFIYLQRSDECVGCQSPTSTWYSLDVATQSGITLSVTPSGASTHVLNWQANGANVSRYHLQRRYLSGAPLTDLWGEVGTLPGTSSGVTITGYDTWSEAEYELVAELTDGTLRRSNRIVTRFPAWGGPRLSFQFPSESAQGAAPPFDAVFLRWSYDQPSAPSAFRLYRRYFDNFGSATAWAVVGDSASSLRAITLGGYGLDDRFELRMNAVLANGTEIPSNVVFVRFPKPSDPLRRPY